MRENERIFWRRPHQRNNIATADAYRGKKGTLMEERLAKHYRMELFFYNLATGNAKRVSHCNDWLDHLQF